MTRPIGCEVRNICEVNEMRNISEVNKVNNIREVNELSNIVEVNDENENNEMNRGKECKVNKGNAHGLLLIKSQGDAFDFGFRRDRRLWDAQRRVIITRT
jgi:hypothetical protein